MNAADHLPVNPRTLLVLLALTEGPLHGYAIKQAVESRSEGRVSLDAGALYRTIARLADGSLVHETPAPADAESTDPRRRYYALTDLGREVVAAEASRLASLVEFARRSAIIG